MTKENNENHLNTSESQAIDETAHSTDESLNTEEQAQDKVETKQIPYDRFKAKVDEANAYKEKLAEYERAQEEAKRKELEETNQYKELYEQALQQAEEAKQQSLLIKKSALLTQAGYNDEQASTLVKLVDGEDDEDIAESIKHLRTLFPINGGYGDPGAFNGEREKPATVDKEEIGRNAVANVLHKIRL